MTAELRPAPARAPFSPRTVFILLLVGVTAFVALGVLGAYAPSLRARARGGDDALSRSAVGYAGLVRLLAVQGWPVMVSRSRPPQPFGAPGLVVFTPPAGTPPRTLAGALPKGRRVLVVAPKWASIPDPAHPGWIAGRVLLPPASVATMLMGRGVGGVERRDARRGVKLVNVAPLFQPDDDLRSGPIEALQTFRLNRGEVQLADPAGRPVLVKLDRDLYVLSDPDLLNNHGLASLDTARTASTVLDELRAGQGPIVWDVTLNGLGRARSLLGLALSPPFLGASLCALAAALLTGVHAAARFGPARGTAYAHALGKAALLDNTAMLIRLARREPQMGRRYAALVRRALGRRVLAMGAAQPAPDDRPERIDAALDRLTPPGEASFSELARDAEGARDTAALMRAAVRLHQRRLEMVGGRS